MKITTKTLATFGMAFLAFNVTAAEKNPLEEARTLDLCVDYSTLKTEDEKKATMKELDRRAQLSVKDHDNFEKKLVEPNNTMCGMYMMLGKPLQEKSRQLRPMVFKVVHVYPEHYYVTHKWGWSWKNTIAKKAKYQNFKRNNLKLNTLQHCTTHQAVRAVIII